MHVRFSQSFGNYESRLQCVIARLLSLSVLSKFNFLLKFGRFERFINVFFRAFLVYSGMLQENSNLLYSGFIEECVETLQLPDISVYMVIN